MQEALRIETKFPVIRRLLHAIGVSIRKKYNWSVDEGPKLPELKDFIHNCYIECAEVISQFDSWDTKQSTTRKLAIDTIKDTIKSEALTMFSVEELIKKTTMDSSRSSRRSTRKSSEETRDDPALDSEIRQTRNEDTTTVIISRNHILDPTPIHLFHRSKIAERLIQFTEEIDLDQANIPVSASAKHSGVINRIVVIVLRCQMKITIVPTPIITQSNLFPWA